MKTERFEMRLDEATAQRIDLWKESQKDNPSRAAAVRRLLDVGLAVAQPNELYLNNSEKLLAYMLCEILKNIGGKRDIDPNFVEKVILGGHYWAFSWEMPGIFHDNIDAPSHVNEVVNILDMWSFIEPAYEALSDKEKNSLDNENMLWPPVFSGFDGNYETKHYVIAKFLVHDMERFRCFEQHETNLNSHSPTLEKYLSMYKVFEPIRKNVIGRKLNIEELRQILTASS